MEAPHAITILAPIELPPLGGDTMWSNQYRAYESLSSGMTRLLDGLRMTHSGAGLARLMGVNEIPVRYHPIVRTHPETGRKALFLGPTRGAAIEGMTKAKSSRSWSFSTAIPLCRTTSTDIGGRRVTW
jgi:taurine dioxygenase